MNLILLQLMNSYQLYHFFNFMLLQVNFFIAYFIIIFRMKKLKFHFENHIINSLYFINKMEELCFWLVICVLLFEA